MDNPSTSTSSGTNTTSTPLEKSSSLDIGHKKGPTQLFSGIQEYKRDSTASEARRASLEDMSAKPKSGILANAWNNTFKGASADK